MSRQKTIWLSLLLCIPVVLFLCQHYFYHSKELQPTGFTNEENVLYMSYAQQYLDQNNFSIAYSNPFDGDADSPRIYFQPVTIFFAMIMKAGIDPGLCLSLFGLLFTFLCIYTGLKILKHLLPENKQLTLIATLFTWGGGLTALAGLIASTLLAGHQTATWIDGIYTADPARGWWGLNWGRTFFIPLEAYYHFLFLLIIYLILKQKWKWATAITLFLSVSHPFTGIECLLILNGWLLTEKFIVRNKMIPWWFCIALILITFIHVGYYLFYLNSFPEHKRLFTQYSTGWTYSLWIAIPAYCIVGALSFFTICKDWKGIRFLSFPAQRLFLCWGVIAFLLSKHEWFIKPMQPIHFTRGYVWAGLFLFGLPALLWLINYLQQKKWKLVLYLFVLLFLSDNILWIINLLREKNTVEWEGHINRDTKEVLDYLKSHSATKDLLVGNARLVNYMAPAYSHSTAWVSHPFNTPDIEQRMRDNNSFLQSASQPPSWSGKRILIIIDKRKEQPYMAPSLLANKIFENNSYVIFTP